MSIINGWLDWAERIDGIADKVYSQPNRGEGIAMHSVVGQEKDFEDGVPNRFLSTEKGADGRYTSRSAASSMFVLRKSGLLIQMYPIWASTWTSGGFDGNTRFWAVEAEGGLNPTTEPLTKAAEDTFIRLVTEWEIHTGRRAQPGVNLLQHKEIARKYGYAATACASDRYDGALVRIIAGERYRKEEQVSDIEERVARLERTFAGHGRLKVKVDATNIDVVKGIRGTTTIGETVEFTGISSLVYIDKMGNNLYLGLQATQERVAALEAAKPEPRVITIPAGTKFKAEVTE